MRALLLAAIIAFGGEQERGLRLYAQGDFVGAAQAFRAAQKQEPDNAEIAYNLALALWSAGDAEAAETAAERAATLSDGALSHLRDGLLGALRYAAAKAKQEEDLSAALELAQRARRNFLRGALAADSGPELHRNLERANLLIDELEKKIEEQEKEESEDKDQEDKEKQEKEDQQKEDKQEGDENEGKEDPQQGEEQDQEPKPKEGEEGAESKEDESQPAPEEGQEGKEGESKPQPESQPEQSEEAEPKELSPEQARRLLEALEKLLEQKQQFRASMRAKRPKVKKDW